MYETFISWSASYFMTKLLVLLADGVEEAEAVGVIDVLRRAGIETIVAGTGGTMITGRNKIRLHADTVLMDMETAKFDGIVLPGGTGAVDNFERNQTVLNLVRDFAGKGKFIGAICAAPRVLVKLGLLKDKRATIYPGMEKLLDRPRPDKVVVDGNIVTSQGPGTAIEFGLKIVEQFQGKAAAERLRQEVVA